MGRFAAVLVRRGAATRGADDAGVQTAKFDAFLGVNFRFKFDSAGVFRFFEDKFGDFLSGFENAFREQVPNRQLL